MESLVPRANGDACAGSGTLHYGTDTVDEMQAFATTWPGVGYWKNGAR
jgi:hypothetical protein